MLGANDGLLSTASLVLGVATAHGTHGSVLVAGLAGLAAGSMSMAAGEYVSVHSQAGTERADLAREKAELLADPERELQELADIYQQRGLKADLALEAATQLMPPPNGLCSLRLLHAQGIQQSTEHRSQNEPDTDDTGNFIERR